MTPHLNSYVAPKTAAVDCNLSNAKLADVTVAIATFNRAKFLPEAIESLLTQTLQPRRLIVIDDGSIDDTREVIKRFGNRIEYIRKENAGKAKALNFILPYIDSEYVWFFDDDDAAYPDALEILLAPFQKKPELGYTAGHFDISNTEASLINSKARSVPYPYKSETTTFQRAQLFRHYTTPMSGSLLRTEAVNKVGGLNDSLLRGQDYELMIKLAANFDFHHCGRPVFILRDHSGPRGPMSITHSASKRGKVWSEFEEKIGEYLINHVPITQFTITDNKDTPSNNARHNYIIRAWATAPKLKSLHALQDIERALNQNTKDPFSKIEKDIISNIYNHQFTLYRCPSFDIDILWRISRRPRGAATLMLISKGIYWTTKWKEQTLLNIVKLLSVSAIFYLSGVILQPTKSLSARLDT